ncbi:hypothetical protein BGZ63DRAFT_379616 [Mariannaea sp. PMI_226]|nr:hypothetical protein BGZ63DRAFT_379616 [Mariannaea sp. PMI_226]
MRCGSFGHISARPLTQFTGAAAIRWHTAYPSPRDIEPESLGREQVLAKLRDGNKLPGTNFLLVDLRGNDHKVSSRQLSGFSVLYFCRRDWDDRELATNISNEKLLNGAEQFVDPSIYQHRACIRPFN